MAAVTSAIRVALLADAHDYCDSMNETILELLFRKIHVSEENPQEDLAYLFDFYRLVFKMNCVVVDTDQGLEVHYFSITEKEFLMSFLTSIKENLEQITL